MTLFKRRPGLYLMWGVDMEFDSFDLTNGDTKDYGRKALALGLLYH
jgi:hypothetical protein